MTKIVNGKIEAGASIISLINEGGNEEETNKLFFLFSNSICISTPEGLYFDNTYRHFIEMHT